MDYKSIYDTLIAKRKNHPAVGMTELHHIVPRCLGGSDSKDNLVALSCREHLVAHKLLARFEKKGAVMHALRMMLLTRTSSRMYAADKAHLKAIQLSPEYRSHLSGKMQQEHVKRKKSEAAKAAWKDPAKRKAFLENRKLTPEILKKRSDSQTKAWENSDRRSALIERNRNISEDTRAAKSASMKRVWQSKKPPNQGKKWYNDGTKSFLLNPTDALGLALGRLSPGVMTPDKQ